LGKASFPFSVLSRQGRAARFGRAVLGFRETAKALLVVGCWLETTVYGLRSTRAALRALLLRPFPCVRGKARMGAVFGWTVRWLLVL
jgi:hypothetical protein